MKKYKYLLFISVVFLVIGCSKKLDEAYQNPNAPTVAPVENIFPGLIGAMLGNSSPAVTGVGLGGDIMYIGRYLQYFNSRTFSAGSAQSIYDQMGGTIGTSATGYNVWAMFYTAQGQNLNNVITWGSQQQKWDFVGAAWALRAWGWLELTDEYDIAILRQAFDQSLQVFNYQEQDEVYDTVRVTCYRALSYLNTPVSNSDFAASDYYFNNGDIDRWKKFVYGILARSYAYISNKSGYSADSVIKYANLAQASNADNSMLKFVGDKVSGHDNYFGPFRGNAGSVLQSQYVADLMSGRNSQVFTSVQDPRAWYVLRENQDSTFMGVTPGQSATATLTSDQIPQNYWGGAATTAPAVEAGRYVFRDSAQFPIMTASEMQFLIAEAAYRKGDMATALAAYTNGISLNFDMLTSVYQANVPASKLITPAMKSAYLSNTAIVPASASNLTLSQIMLQKYIALYVWGTHETWVDMRRFHYTDVDQSTGNQVYANFAPPGPGVLYSDNQGAFAYRVRPYYSSEYLYNIAALKAVGAIIGTNTPVLNYITFKPWFAQ